ncbi:UDP-4-amino-4,6-dideoxy-N-acetyl-beta-L-altrosamine transaminase [Methanoculleus horonobensis]|uniref:UDP-4-amino-4, 6-dideoxy-N-acetyl-beta-L-altrosamine transaminase n=1 Tax=Methanoculleus horonobensis TaxID=528314 RepID=UPI00082D6BFF|nr:UDP-4-amino-4,6-dideoxy-N-acetyl-beta-L-altrosamine transaminase [Methanoculleus horonobensis]
MRFIPYGHQLIDDDDILSVVEVLKSDWLTTGPAVDLFEKELASYVGARHTVAVNSGTSALDIAVQALDLPRGSEIITTPFTFAATSNAILYNGHIPIFADIDPITRNIHPDEIRKRISSKTRAIIYVDYAGHPCAIDEIEKIAREHGLLLIEDACHALGTSYKGRKIGTFADMTVFSFHPVKPITTGEGGAVVTENSELYAKLRLLRSHGITRDVGDMFGEGASWGYDMQLLGRNYRMTDIQAALGVSQLRKIDSFIERRNELAALYTRALSDLEWLDLPRTQEHVTHGWHLYTILLKGLERSTLFPYLKERGIGVNVHYIPTYKFSYYQRHYPQNANTFPSTEDIFSRIITLPLYPGMSDEDVEYVSVRLHEAESDLKISI